MKAATSGPSSHACSEDEVFASGRDAARIRATDWT
jgi:hypothetical protein